MAKKAKQEKFQLIRWQDISYAAIKRSLVLGVIIDGPLNQVELTLAGHDALKFAATYMPDVQGVALLLWNDKEKVSVEEAVAAVNWCPIGKWELIGDLPVTDNIFAVEFDRQVTDEQGTDTDNSTGK